MGPKKQTKNAVQQAPKQPQTPPPEYTLTGYGRFQYVNGNIYQGNYRLINNQKVKHGYGKLTISNFIQTSKSQQSYQGNWQNDKMQGFGIYIYPYGDVYTGQWHENKHEGKGKMQFGNGTFYDGQWKDHKIQGNGIFKDSLGRVWQGQFRNNEYKSRMQIRLANQKQQQIRKNQIKTQIQTLINQTIKILQQSNEQNNLITNVQQYFANQNRIKQLIKNTQIGFQILNKEQWLTLLKNANQNNYFILNSASQSKTILQQNILMKQQSGKGQIVQIQIKQGKPGRLFVINIQRKRWVVGGFIPNK